MAFSAPASRSELAEINITPLVDVMLVLLVIFMVTAPVLSRPIETMLPQPVPPVKPVEPPMTWCSGSACRAPTLWTIVRSRWRNCAHGWKMPASRIRAPSCTSKRRMAPTTSRS